MNAAHIGQAQRFLADATRCADCGLPKAEIVTKWKRGTPTEYAASCQCPTKVDPSVRSIPYDNAPTEDELAVEFDTDYASESAPMRGRINYGTNVDPFGGAA